MKNSKSQQTSNKKASKQTNNKEQICDICAQDVPGPERKKIFAFGKCDHYVCYVCSTRLRVVCDQFDCPICREKLDCVVFSANKGIPFAKYNKKNCSFNEKYKIYYETEAIREAFEELFKFDCLVCLKNEKQQLSKSPKQKTINNVDDSAKTEKEGDNAEIFKSDVCLTKDKQNLKNGLKNTKKVESTGKTNSSQSTSKDSNDTCLRMTSPIEDICKETSASERFEEDAQGLSGGSHVMNKSFSDIFGLKNHLSYVHKLKLCDLCLSHSKLFPFEYSYYSSSDLKTHMLKGELNTSHHGHPKCQLCHNIFFNLDELLWHMQREHISCHLCERLDTNTRIYFSDYNGLREHFKSRHVLCERDGCKDETFTSAFDSELDYQVHLVQVHGFGSTSGLSRSENRQQRTITLPSSSHRTNSPSNQPLSRINLPPNAAIVSTGSMATANSARQVRPPESMQSLIRQQRLPTRAEFPALGQTSDSSNLSRQPTTISTYAVTSNQYPTLAQSFPTSASTTIPAYRPQQFPVAGPSNTAATRALYVRTFGGGYRPPARLTEMDFPPLPEQPKPKGKPKSKNQTNSRLNDNGPLTLDQLISTSLTLSSNRNNKINSGKKSNNAKTSSNKHSNKKNVKQKSLKIQLS